MLNERIREDNPGIELDIDNKRRRDRSRDRKRR